MRALMAILVVLAMAGSAKAEVLQLHLANNDTSQAQRKQAGDIISVHDAGHKCGAQTLRKYLVVWVDFDTQMESKQAGRGLQTQLREDCSFEVGDESLVVAQARFKIDLSELDALAQARGIAIDWKRLRDPNDPYQPFFDNAIVFDYSDLICDKCRGSQKLSATELREIADYATTGVVAVTPGPKEK